MNFQLSSSFVEFLDDEYIVLLILSYCSFPTLLAKKAVSQRWKQLCQKAVEQKLSSTGRKKFASNLELEGAIRSYIYKDPERAEKLAGTYGWPIGTWDVSQVEDFSELFYEQRTFNEDISSWDTSQVWNMDRMFYQASSFNGDLSSWDTSNVKYMKCMFRGASDFNGDISSWDTSNVIDMAFMFHHAYSFNGNLSTWDTSNVINMAYMFHCASKFNGDISYWDTSKVTDMNHMFCSASSFNANISSWDTSSLENMESMFHNAKSFNQDISSWDIAKAMVNWIQVPQGRRIFCTPKPQYVFLGATSMNPDYVRSFVAAYEKSRVAAYEKSRGRTCICCQLKQYFIILLGCLSFKSEH